MDIEAYRLAGSIAARVRDETAFRVKNGSSVLEIAEWAEVRIKELGGVPAFPVNISINEVAAHYTPIPLDTLLIENEGLVKVDIGVHVNGHIADTAVTVDLGGHNDLILAASDALESAIEVIRPGVRAGEIGRVVESVAHSYGVNPVVDLSGHHLDLFNLHTGRNIPNYGRRLTHAIKEGDVLAVEPFITYGCGRVRQANATIFRTRRTWRKIMQGSDIYNRIRGRFGGLPFSPRWISGDLSPLIQCGAVEGYPVLIDIDSSPVAQAEHTLIVTKDGCEVITR